MSTQKLESINPIKPSALLPLARLAAMTNRFLMVTGSGGSGKTSIVCNILGPEMARRVCYVNLNGQGPQEVIGYGIPQANGDMKFAAPDIWPTHSRVGDEPILLFLDECNDYDPAVRALLRSLYPASGDRYVGPHKLGSNVFVVCATNRRQDGTRSAVEDAPFTERCVKVTLEPDLSDWMDWADGVPALADSGSHVPAFLKFGTTTGDGLDFFNPPVVMPYDGAPHPCPRTWEAVMLAESARRTDRETFRTFVRGSVGDRAATALFGFLQHVDAVPDIIDIKRDAEGFNLPSDPAGQFAIVSACLSQATRGVRDIPAAVHSGGFDWLVTTLLRVRGDIREFGARSAVRRGIPLDEHSKSNQLILV
jgi:hypothetical protein